MSNIFEYVLYALVGAVGVLVYAFTHAYSRKRTIMRWLDGRRWR